MKYVFILALVIGNIFTTYACINGETKILKDGTIIAEDQGQENYIIPYGHNFYKINYDKKAKELYDLWLSTKKIDYLSDIGVIYILQGEYQKAKEHYLDIEKRKPGRYSTASNLGTVYELLGENENALSWIRRSYKIDPKSHWGSEWLHIKILEAKIKGPSFVNAKFLIDTEFGDQEKPVTNLSATKLKNLQRSIYYQLNERMSFIKEKDPIIALLLFEQGNTAFINAPKETALLLYKKAKQYGYSSPLIEKRIAAIDPQHSVEKTTPLVKSSNRNYGWIWFVISASLLMAIILFMMRKRKLI